MKGINRLIEVIWGTKRIFFGLLLFYFIMWGLLQLILLIL
jgi:hypothetical protein